MEIDKLNVPSEDEVEPKLGDKIPENYLDKATAELKSGYREIDISRNGSIFSIRIENPSIGDELKINKEYTKKFNELVRDGTYFTKKEIENELKKRGVITAIDETKTIQLNKNIQKLIEDYNLYLTSNSKPSDKKMKEMRSQYFEMRDKLFEHNRVMNEHFANSIESICEQYQTFLKMVLCIKDSKGNPIWNSIEDFYNEKIDRLFISQCIQESQMFWSGIGREVLYDLPGVLENMHQGGTLENSQEVDGKLTSA